MSDNLKIRHPQDPQKINVHEVWELDYWSTSLRVSKDQLNSAVSAVGTLVIDVKKYLEV